MNTAPSVGIATLTTLTATQLLPLAQLFYTGEANPQEQATHLPAAHWHAQGWSEQFVHDYTLSLLVLRGVRTATDEALEAADRFATLQPTGYRRRFEPLSYEFVERDCPHCEDGDVEVECGAVRIDGARFTEALYRREPCVHCGGTGRLTQEEDRAQYQDLLDAFEQDRAAHGPLPAEHHAHDYRLRQPRS